MKPRYLEFCGINSFSEPAKIDFTALSEFGIFGIFGDTGSGKSTILDCISFALYGEISRLRGGVSSDAINYRCDKAEVTFEFEIVYGGARRVFRVERRLTRGNKANRASVWEWENGAWQARASAIKEADAYLARVIGLTQSDFEKCIALPQGQFAQFVRFARTDRVRLIARLFDLEAYGDRLSQRVNRRMGELDTEVKVLQTRLEPYAAYTEAYVSAVKEELETLSARETTLNEALKLARGREKALAAAAERRKEAERLKARFALLSEKREEMETLERELSRLEKADAVLLSEREGISARERAEYETKNAESANLRLARAKATLEALPPFDEESAEAEIVRLTEVAARAKESEREVARIAKARSELASVSAQFAEEAKKFKGFSYDEERAALEKQLEALGGDYFTYLETEGKAALLAGEYARFAEELEAIALRCPAAAADCNSLAERYRKLAEEGSAFGDVRAAFAAREEARKAAERALHDLERYNGDYKVHRQRLQELQTRFVALKEETQGYQEAEESMTAEAAERAAKEKRDERRKYAEAKKRAEDEFSAATLASGTASEREKAAKTALEGARERYRAACAAGNFTGAEEARSLLKKFGEADEARRSLEAFKAEYAAVSSRLSEWKEEEEASDEALALARKEVADTEAQVQETTRLFARKEDEYGRALEGHGKKLELTRELSEKRAESELVGRLKTLFYGNKFMEFVAEECLQSITSSAGERLLGLTGGHYFLRYDGGFFVGDNFNGGELRPVNTLSGGETFLVSLSLALSLSSEICAKSLRPIEFFFLDEGFGTLDGKLVDVVLDSLETLKNENFCIGLISHVEELKHRIDKKLLVIKATEKHGSQIQAE